VISQSIDRKQEILAAALRLFAVHGFHGTPTSKIAKEAGVANGTLFHYFNTKEDLIVSLYISIKMRMAAYVDEKASDAATVKDKFRNQYTEVLKWSLQNMAEFQFLQQFSSSPYASLISPEEVKKQIDKTCGQIDEAIKAKVIKKHNPEFILALFTSHTFGLHQYLVKHKMATGEQDKLIKESFEMLWTMLS
jgi:AcrR family transcriptional regulator